VVDGSAIRAGIIIIRIINFSHVLLTLLVRFFSTGIHCGTIKLFTILRLVKYQGSRNISVTLSHDKECPPHMKRSCLQLKSLRIGELLALMGKISSLSISKVYTTDWLYNFRASLMMGRFQNGWHMAGWY